MRYNLIDLCNRNLSPEIKRKGQERSLDDISSQEGTKKVNVTYYMLISFRTWLNKRLQVILVDDVSPGDLKVGAGRMPFYGAP